MPELTHVHEQRLRSAVEAKRKGATIHFRVNPGEPQTIVWWQSGKTRVQHTIANAFGSGDPMLRAVEKRFQEMCHESEN
jgi:hypothetical protein